MPQKKKFEFTYREGGRWIGTLETSLTEDDLISSLADNRVKDPDHGMICMFDDYGLPLCIHAIRFDDGRVWDAYNGYRQ